MGPGGNSSVLATPQLLLSGCDLVGTTQTPCVCHAQIRGCSLRSQLHFSSRTRLKSHSGQAIQYTGVRFDKFNPGRSSEVRNGNEYHHVPWASVPTRPRFIKSAREHLSFCRLTTVRRTCTLAKAPTSESPVQRRGGGSNFGT